eukprot:TRINITY_DN9839_c0_g1_i1.p3 TRINITY_DN9839_c0_g1~~TRINITY_DN9839_c0_g1_i1.p3  ORF type:complete len:135 (-),score=19.29 TRINITY_DN9839_c0_g1_i1:177-581(-)
MNFCLQTQGSVVKGVKQPVGCYRRPVRRPRTLSIRAERDGNGSSFMSGFMIGGMVFGTLGFLFAPQISRALLNDEQKLRLPRWLEEEEKDPEATRMELFEKIDQLNKSIDDISSNLKQTEAVPVEVEKDTQVAS